MMDYAEALRFLRGRIERDGHLVGVAAGSGITAKYAVAGGCDLVLALSSGKYRQMGCSSMAGFLCYANSNDLVMDYALRELMRPCAGVPLLFGLNASDPTRAMYDYIREIKKMGFTGVVNYPTAGMIDGRFRAALEEKPHDIRLWQPSVVIPVINYALHLQSCDLRRAVFAQTGHQFLHLGKSLRAFKLKRQRPVFIVSELLIKFMQYINQGLTLRLIPCEHLTNQQ